jgi:sec-independent protein translocase protein TatB
MFGPLGFPELLFISLLALLIFGPKKLPELGRTLGKAMAEFRKATTDLKRTINAELIEQELREADPRKMVRDSLREAKESLEKAVQADDRRAAAQTAAAAPVAAPAPPEDPTEPPPEPEDPSATAAEDAPAAAPPDPHPGFGPAGAVARGAALEEEAAEEKDRPPDEAPRPAAGS